MRSLRAKGIKAGRKISKDIFFNAKRRKELKRIFLKIQKEILENSDFSIKPLLKKEHERRVLEVSAFDFAIGGLKAVKNAEENDKRIYLTECKFFLFKKGKSLVFKSTFLKPLINRVRKVSYFYFPQGFPETTKKKAWIYKDGKGFNLRGYRFIDSGTFRQKMIDFYKFRLHYKGQKENYKFTLKLIDEEKQSYWVTNYE